MGAGVTVTGGAGKAPINLTFGDSRTAVAAESLSHIISNEFAAMPATYATPPGFSSSGAPNGYVVIDTPGTMDSPFGEKAITVTQPATVFGGAADGQQVLAQGDLSYSTSYQNGEILLGEGANTVTVFEGLNTVYGGNGSDTINVLANFNGTVNGGVTTIYAGSGTTAVTDASGLASVVGSTSASGMLTVNDADQPSTVDGGFGTLVEFSAAGIALGGQAGGNVIIGSNVSPVTITGGGTGNLLDGESAGTVITGGDGNDTINVSSADETVNVGYGPTTVNIYAGSGTVTATGGVGVGQVNVDTGAVSFQGGAGNTVISLSNDSDPTMAGYGTIVGGYGSLYVSVAGGDTGTVSIQGGTAGNNDLFGGAGNTTLVGGGNSDFIQAGTGNTSLVGTNLSGDYSMLVAGNGADTLTGSTASSSTTDFNFSAVTTTGQTYLINNFLPTPMPGTSGDNIYFGNQADAAAFVMNATQVGPNVTTTVGGNTYILSNTTLKPDGTINGTPLSSHVAG